MTSNGGKAGQGGGAGKTGLAALGGLAALIRDPGTILFTLRSGNPVGADDAGNRYFEERKARAGKRARRWVVYGAVRDASSVPPEWHAWLHYTVDKPLAASSRPWQKPHQPNLTGTQASYRPPGHDYEGGHQTAAYEAWTPGA